MIYDICHTTRFDYGAAVRFARCNLRLKPIHWSGQHVESHTLDIEPAGSIGHAHAEAGLANVARLVVDTAVQTLTIESRARVAVDRLIPIPADDDPTLREIAAAALTVQDLGPASPAGYLYPSPLIPLDPDIAAWCRRELAPDRGIMEAGISLARAIQRDFAFDAAATLVDTPPRDAFLQRRGVCQDFAQIMITGLRCAGLPAAYVSGYIRTIPPSGQPRLVGADATHAWVMLWCGPERGWIGFDPTNGIWMAEDHIVVAIGRDYAEIAPVDGVVLGSGAQSMEVSVDVAPIDVATVPV